jgi:hypothetical protein
MEQLRKAAYSSNKNVTPKLDDLKKESKMVVACRSNHTLLQDEFLSCKLVEKNTCWFIFNHVSDMVIAANVFYMDGSGFRKM